MSATACFPSSGSISLITRCVPGPGFWPRWRSSSCIRTSRSPNRATCLLAVDHLPRAARGLLVAGFLAAFMSTIATHLNWGTSYLVSDFYRRFVTRDRTGAALRCRLALGHGPAGNSRGACVSWELATIRSGWEVLLEVGAGTGSVYLLRWYWWRVNAWSEIAAMSTALVVSLDIRLDRAVSRLRACRLRQADAGHHR